MAWFRSQGFESFPFGEPRLIDLDGTSVQVTLRRSHRARRLRLKVADGRLEIVVPLRVSRAQAQKLVSTHRQWILKHVEAQSKESLEQGGAAVYYLGSRHTVRVVETQRAGVLLVDDGFVVYGSEAGRQLEEWLRQHAETAVQASLDLRAREMGLVPERIQLRDQKTKWGACTSRGTVTFSWRLIMAPPEVLDYVVVHELAHLKEMNHSARFWEIVKKHCPNHLGCRKWLREHGRLLKLPEL